MRPTTSRALALAAIAALPITHAHADLINDDFESDTVGQLPGSPWHDIAERAVDMPVPSPTLTVIETTDAHGNPTRGVQTSAVKGTNGAFLPIDHARHHTVSMDVRIDQAPATNQGWPIAVGFIKDAGVGSGDVNANPQALIYGWNNQRWRFFVSQGQDLPAIDFAMAGLPYEIGAWYRFTITVDTELGLFRATVADAATGQIRNVANLTHASWNPERGMYDAITLFDGESANSTTTGQATIDNVSYVPAPGAALTIGACSAALMMRRRRG